MEGELTNESLVKTFTERQIEAALLVLETAGLEPEIGNVRRFLNREVLSFTEDERGHYCWYLDEAGNELCVKVETLEEMEICEWD